MINATNLDRHSAQEVFDFVATHLITQNKISLAGNSDSFIKTTSCAYRGDNGLKCAAGCLIPDELYEKEFEGMSWNGVLDHSSFKKYHSELILALQHMHDRMEDIPNPDWRGRLREFAGRNSLSTEAIDKLKSGDVQ